MRKHNFKNLEVWKKSRALVLSIYEVSALFPQDEKFGIIAQIRRAIVSISLNISEGSGRTSNKEFSHFLDIAYSSSLEVETILYLCFDLKYISELKLNDLVIKLNEIQKMINGLQGKIIQK